MSHQPNWQNRTLFRRDNLDILRAMNDESVHLIATDPPFNKGKDFHATPDSLASGASFHDRWSWQKDVHEEWCDQIQDDWPQVWHVIQGSLKSYGEPMGAYLCYMAVRLIAMHRILRDDGGIYLHCDQTASHYLKQLLDAIFGRKNFRNEIVWHYGGPARLAKYFPKKHDVLLFYTKTGKYRFNHVHGELPDYLYDRARRDPDGRLWVDQRLGVVGETLERYRAEGRTFVTKGGGERLKQYLDEMEGKPLDSVWSVPIINSQSKERTGYPTQKPIALYEKMVLASSNEGDVVLDPFAGCATTCVCAELHNRQWVGVDFWHQAQDVLLQRMETMGLCAPKKAKSRGQFNFAWQDITFTDQIPQRTDEGKVAAPRLKTVEKVAEPPSMSRADMKAQLIRMHGGKCSGCEREFKDERYLELDHNTPRSSGGINHISNRVLLCGPCNRLKSDTLTLKGLQRENRKRGYMADQEA